MKLNQFAASKRLAIFDELVSGREPSEGEFDAQVLKEAKSKGSPQVGTTRYAPHALTFEYIYPDPTSTATVLSVTVTPPERIVMLPVPDWVVESIWQGEIAGSYHFESDARAHLDAFLAELEPDANLKWFGPQPAKRRD